MKPISQFNSRTTRVVFTDIDGTLTQQGKLPAASYSALWSLAEAGLNVIPVTGRPAGWCEMIARLWPVYGVVGENGALFFRLDSGKMRRKFVKSKSERSQDRANLRKIRQEVLSQVPGCAVSSDQFSRLFDLAIDFGEDVKPLAAKDIKKIVALFHKHGATAKVSNIHVNGWYGNYDKLSTCLCVLESEFQFAEKHMKRDCVFVGDSPNDEPMFEFFPHAFAVANIAEFLPQLKHQPAYVTEGKESEGFCQVAERLLALQSR